jgi:hypothetical protein
MQNDPKGTAADHGVLQATRLDRTNPKRNEIAADAAFCGLFPGLWFSCFSVWRWQR